MVFQDEPDHKRLRGIVQKAFTPRRLALMENEVGDVVTAAVDRLLHRLGRDGGPFDLLNEFAYGIPATVICRMLNVPDDDQGRFIAWSDDLVAVISGEVGAVDRNERAHRAVVALENYLSDRIEAAHYLQDGGLLADLVAAEADGERLTRTEVIATAILLLFAGHRTTACLIANGFNALMRHPDQYERLRLQPAMVNSAVEEFLRWEGHTKLSVRIVRADLEWSGQTLRRGERVFLVPVLRRPRRIGVPRRRPLRHRSGEWSPPRGVRLGHPSLPRRRAGPDGGPRLVGGDDRRLPGLEPVEPRPRWVPTLISRTQSALPVRIRPEVT